mgnify:CR=1 FL=1
MASSSSAFFQIKLFAEQQEGAATAESGTPAGSQSNAGALSALLENATGGRRWTEGQASGNIDRVFYNEYTVGSTETDSYDVLAAGSLLDLLGQAIDLDELKVLVVKCTSGSIQIAAPAANFLGIFADATDLINFTSGQTVAFDFGAAGLAIGTDSKFDIIETASSTAAYSIAFIGSN